MMICFRLLASISYCFAGTLDKMILLAMLPRRGDIFAALADDDLFLAHFAFIIYDDDMRP